jgi:hypothetical protein
MTTNAFNWTTKFWLPMLLLMLSAFSVSIAQGVGKAEPSRIQFKPGANSTTISGSVRDAEEFEYVLAGKKRQKLILKITSVPARSSGFDIKAPGNADMGLEFDTNMDYAGVLPRTGDYLISVARTTVTPGTSRYSLSVSVR